MNVQTHQLCLDMVLWNYVKPMLLCPGLFLDDGCEPILNVLDCLGLDGSGPIGTCLGMYGFEKDIRRHEFGIQGASILYG